MANTRQIPPLVQLERQCRATLALLPLVSALPFIDEGVIARVFGQSMLMLNWIPQAPAFRQSELPVYRRTPRTKAEQRAYWREAKRRARAANKR